MKLRDLDYVTFTEGAQLLVDEGLVTSMTPRGLRYISRAAGSGWPFGDDDGQEPYRMAGRTRQMRTEVLLAYFRKNPPKGRGPDRQPRQRPGGVS